MSNTIKKETQNDSWNERSENMERAVIIEKNPEALLQRVRLIRNAKEDIILSTFALVSNPIHTGPKEPVVWYQLGELMKNAKERVKIHTPYIICNDMMYNTCRTN